MPVNEQIVDAVAMDNVKTVAGSPSFYASIAMGDAVDHQRRVRALAEGALSCALTKMMSMDPAEAVSIVKMMSGNDIAAAQQAVKAAQTTPPPTAG